MRNISAASLAKLASRLGTEPIVIVEIGWVDGSRMSYADRDIDGAVKGRILDVSGLDNVVNVSGGGQSQQISVVMDDHDGEIKGIMDHHDIHKRPCWVYQWFDGIPLSDKFLIFKGEVNSPIEWNEGDRTVSFDVISKIEDVEVGFSIEEGRFPIAPEELVGKAWPLVFGTCINVPALRVQSPFRGTLGTSVGIADFMLPTKLAAAQRLICPDKFQGYIASYNGGFHNGVTIREVWEEDPDCVKRRCEAIETLSLSLSEQRSYEYTTLRIFGGESFPQGQVVTIDIDGAKFTGTFNGEIFTVTSRRHPDYDPATGGIAQTDEQHDIRSRCGIPSYMVPGTGLIDENGELPEDLHSAKAALSKQSWEAFNAIELAGFHWVNAGSEVHLDGDQEIIYIANLLPSTIHRVSAFRSINGGSRQLVTVPEEYYTIRQVDYQSYQVMEIVFTRPLSSRGDGWEDDLYVTLTSSVGPNTVDILRWFIETYTDYAINEASFTAVRAKIDNYPMHFPLLERRNITDVLEEIAYQARCAIWMADDVFYLRYLSEEPTAVDTITASDVLNKSLKIFHSPTEDLVTKYVAGWVYDHAREEPNTVILRHNVAKYGTHEEEFDYFTFNIYELVKKSATFWLIRKANTWRKASFKTPVSKLNLEVFDCVTLDLPHVCPTPVKAIIEKANYDSNDHSIEFEVWTPIKSGTLVPYDFAWPAYVEETALFPTDEELDQGWGGGQDPNFSMIAPNDHALSLERGLAQGFTSVHRDWLTEYEEWSRESSGQGSSRLESTLPSLNDGDRKPSDNGDTKPEPKVGPDVGGTSYTGKPNVPTYNPTAAQALTEAQNSREENQSAAERNGEGGDQQSSLDDAKEKLPEAQPCGGGTRRGCYAYVQVIKARIKAVVPSGSGTSTSQPGAYGRVSNHENVSTECYNFNSQEAASAFASEMSVANPWYGTVGEIAVNPLTITGSMDLGLTSSGGECIEPDAEDQAMTGYKETPIT